MADLPLSMTTEVAAYVEGILLRAQRDPKLLARAIVLCFLPAPGYPFREAHVGWLETEHLDADYVELALAGFRVFVRTDCLAFLRGKTIGLEQGRMGAVLAVRDPDAPKWSY